MKKIVIDARESGTTTGRYVDKLIEHLYKLNPEFYIVVVTKPSREDYIKKIAPGFRVVATNIKEFTFSEQLRFCWLLKKLRADLVHFCMAQQPVLYRKNKITSIQDLTTVRFVNRSKNYLVFKFKQLIYGWVIKKVSKQSSLVLAPSRFVKEDLIKYTGLSENKFVVTYLAAEPINETPEIIDELKNKKFILYVGRPMEHKNLKRLILAFSLSLQKNPDLYLVLAGKKDSNFLMIENFVKQKDINNVVFTNYVSDAKLKWLYRNCRMYAFPSLSEGFGLPGLEAMVEGAPVVSSNKTCLPEIYGNGALYFDPLDIGDINEKINKVLGDESFRSKLIKNGYNQAQKYSWEKTAKQILNIYKDVLG